eukprot:363784-Rhodomonas_salina.1
MRVSTQRQLIFVELGRTTRLKLKVTVILRAQHVTSVPKGHSHGHPASHSTLLQYRKGTVTAILLRIVRCCSPGQGVAGA